MSSRLQAPDESAAAASASLSVPLDDMLLGVSEIPMEIDSFTVASVTVAIQTEAVIILQPYTCEDAATVTDDIIGFQYVDHDHSYSDSCVMPVSPSVSTREETATTSEPPRPDESLPESPNESCNSGSSDDQSNSKEYTPKDESPESESSGSSNDDIDDDKQRHFIVSEKCLMTLFCICHIVNCCKPLISKPITRICGFAVAVTTECIDGHTFIWHSQPKIGNMYSCNMLIPSSLFITGHSYSLYKEMCDLVHLCALSVRECYNIQKAFIIPELNEIWTCHSEAIMSAVQGMKLIASGDARCDSPGHNASFGTYSIMDTHSKLIIAQETVRVTEVKKQLLDGGGRPETLPKQPIRSWS